MATRTGEDTLLVKNVENGFEVETSTETGDTTLIHISSLNSFVKNNIQLDRISVLQLEKCAISEIPSVIHKLNNLKQLILRHNKLVEVPSCLYSGLHTLELLDLSHNLIKNFDIEPACSLNITILKLNNNRIHNLPHWILTLRCPKLVELIYSHNFVTNLKASNQVNFKKLEMQNCNLIDVDFKFLRSINKLEYLDISNSREVLESENLFKNIDTLFVKAKWKNLKVLILNNLTLSVPPPGIFWITTITELHLVNCDLNWIPEEIKYLKKLQVLDVSNNSICSLPTAFYDLPNLKVVRAPHNCISTVLDFTNNLDILDLYDNDLESPVSDTHKIKLIDLERNIFESALTEDYEIYLNKCEQFRRIFCKDRTKGPKEVPEDSYLSCTSSCTDETYSFESEVAVENITNLTQDQVEDENWECWDEEQPRSEHPLLKRDPEITPSDDEWEGKIDLKKIDTDDKSKIRFKYTIDINEDWIFCDVEDVVD